MPSARITAKRLPRGHAPVAKRLRARACAPSYQRDISSMAIQVAIEQPNSA